MQRTVEQVIAPKRLELPSYHVACFRRSVNSAVRRFVVFMKLINKLPRLHLLLLGWAIFVVAIFLPVNVSIGGLTDAGRPHYGLINLFYSFACIYIIPFEGLPWNNLVETADIFMGAGLGICNFLLLLSPAMLWLKGRKAIWAGRLMIVAVFYVCTIGFVHYRNFPLLYGHYVWCLSFIVVAVALNLTKPKPEFD